MANQKVGILCVLLLVMVVIGEATPPGIANNPSHATCKIKKYKHCYNLVHVCPKFCPNGCTVECASCKPICTDASTPPSPPDQADSPSQEAPAPNQETPSPSPSLPPSVAVPPTPSLSPPTPSNPSPVPSPPPPSVPTTAPSPGRSTNTPSPPSPSTSPSPAPSTHLIPPPPPPSTPPPVPSTPSTPSPVQSPSSPSVPTTAPSPAPSTDHAPSPPPSSTPSPVPSTPSTPSPVPSPSSPSVPTTAPSPAPSTDHTPSPPPSSTPSPVPPAPLPPSPSPPSPTSTAQCKNKNYTHCYNVKHFCPASCPGGCEVDCVTCKPVCKCDRPGAVCQDPRFIGGDGLTFYFHGKKDRDFCLVSDSNLHINGHFIGRRNDNMRRDFTWVQSIAILFGKHQVYIGALKTSTWNDSVESLSITVDGQQISLPESDGAAWRISGLSVVRAGETNDVVVEAEGNFKITAKVVPITEEDSRIHNYGVTSDDCLAHLDLGFKFYALSDGVDGVLGQTYRPGYMSHVNIGVKMPVMGGDREFQTSDLFTADCSVARFDGGSAKEISHGMELPGLSCASGIDGQGVGVVCKR